MNGCNIGHWCYDLITGYKEQLKENPTLSLSSFCASNDLPYRKLIDWMRRNNVSVRGMKAELRPVISDGVFVPIAPQCSASAHRRLEGVDIKFSDGVSLHLNQCGVEELISLMTMYKHRLAVKEEACSL